VALNTITHNPILNQYHLDGVIVNILIQSVEGCPFETKNYNFGICFFSKSKDWLVQGQDDVSKVSDMSSFFCRLPSVISFPVDCPVLFQ